MLFVLLVSCSKLKSSNIEPFDDFIGNWIEIEDSNEFLVIKKIDKNTITLKYNNKKLYTLTYLDYDTKNEMWQFSSKTNEYDLSFFFLKNGENIIVNSGTNEIGVNGESKPYEYKKMGDENG